MRVKGGGEREREGERERDTRLTLRTNSGCGSGVGDRQGYVIKPPSRKGLAPLGSSALLPSPPTRD